MIIMAELWQFVSRSDMTRDKMSQPLVACGLWLFLFFRIILIHSLLQSRSRIFLTRLQLQ